MTKEEFLAQCFEVSERAEDMFKRHLAERQAMEGRLNNLLSVALSSMPERDVRDSMRFVDGEPVHGAHYIAFGNYPYQLRVRAPQDSRGGGIR